MRWKIEYRNGAYYAYVKPGWFWRAIPRFVHMWGEEYDFRSLDDALKAISAQ